MNYASQYRSRYGPLVKAIPWGVDVRSAPPPRLKAPADPLNVLFVGQMRPYKGVETLLAAVAGQPWAEAFGLVLLEGMAAGCVPVASDLPGVRDVAGPRGLLVPPGRPGALCDALCDLWRDPTQLGKLQQDSWLAAQSLSWERCVASYEDVLVDAVCRRYARLHGFATLPEAGRRDRG